MQITLYFYYRTISQETHLLASFSIYFPRPKSTRFIHNSRLNDATDFIFAPPPNIIKGNIS